MNTDSELPLPVVDMICLGRLGLGIRGGGAFHRAPVSGRILDFFFVGVYPGSSYVQRVSLGCGEATTAGMGGNVSTVGFYVWTSKGPYSFAHTAAHR